MKIRPPTVVLAEVYHLARFADKARLKLAGELPADYEIAFCSKLGLDGIFLKHFGISSDSFVSAVEKANDDEALAAWFTSKSTEEQRLEWNRFSPDIGRPGTPMARVFDRIKPRLYPSLPSSFSGSIFEAIAIDET